MIHAEDPHVRGILVDELRRSGRLGKPAARPRSRRHQLGYGPSICSSCALSCLAWMFGSASAALQAAST